MHEACTKTRTSHLVEVLYFNLYSFGLKSPLVQAPFTGYILSEKNLFSRYLGDYWYTFISSNVGIFNKILL